MNAYLLIFGLHQGIHLQIFGLAQSQGGEGRAVPHYRKISQKPPTPTPGIPSN